MHNAVPLVWACPMNTHKKFQHPFDMPSDVVYYKLPCLQCRLHAAISFYNNHPLSLSSALGIRQSKEHYYTVGQTTTSQVKRSCTFMNQLQVDTVSHLVLQIYLGPTKKKQLYHINVTTITGQHEGTLAILKKQNEKVLTTCSYTHTSRTMLKLKPFFQILGKREKGFVHTVHACTVVTCIPLHYTKRTANFSLSAERPHCIMRHIWKVWKSEQPSYLAATNLTVISELQRKRLHATVFT